MVKRFLYFFLLGAALAFPLAACTSATEEKTVSSPTPTDLNEQVREQQDQEKRRQKYFLMKQRAEKKRLEEQSRKIKNAEERKKQIEMIRRQRQLMLRATPPVPGRKDRSQTGVETEN